MSLYIPDRILRQMITLAKTEAPLEACGLLTGQDNNVTKLYPMTNIDKSPDHFMMEPEEQFAVVKQMRKEGLKMLGIFHSHPNSPARLSDEDMRLALTPNVVYVILSLKEQEKPEIKAFKVDNGKTEEAHLSIIQSCV